jgi:DNA-binding protein HU-beta
VLIFQETEFTMNNNDLAESLAASNGLTKANARQLVDDLFTAIVEAAARGEEVSLTGFGKFKIKDTPAREGRNPATGATIQIAAAKKLGFTPAKAVKDRLAK